MVVSQAPALEQDDEAGTETVARRKKCLYW